MNELFRHFAKKAADVLGTVWAFLIAVIVIVVWAVTGPYFKFSETWQLIINTGTTIVTFLMVFLIQNTQNRDARAIHLKLDELLRAVGEARTGLVDLEDLTDEELAKLQTQFEDLRKQNPHDSNLEVEAVEVKAEHAERTAVHAEKKADKAEDVAKGAAREVAKKR
jgi:low affinity Fe/Cu permease